MKRFLCACASLLMLLFCSCATQEDAVRDNVIAEKQSVSNFFHSNKETIVSIKEYAEKENPLAEIIYGEDDGYITLENAEKLWVNNVSESIAALFANMEEMRSIEFSPTEFSENHTYDFFVEFYFPDSMVVMRLIYSKTDLTAYSTWYEALDENWFLWVAGMT